MMLFQVVFLFCFVFLPFSLSTTLPGNILPQLNGVPSCGYQGLGSLLQVSSSIQVCLPPVFCNPETCPPQLGTCVNGQCQYIGSYKGLATHPKAIATYYCELTSGGCNGALGGSILDMATNAAASLNLQLCKSSTNGGGNCMGIAATSPMLIGNSQIAHFNTTTFVPLWGLGYTYASGLCYELTGPGGQITVAMTDRCAGYCRCDGSQGNDQAAYHECGERQCYDSPNLFPNQPCSGTLPQLGYNSCAGFGCPGAVLQKCDWCASNLHPHFDVDIYAFKHLCGSAGSYGSCELTAVRPISCDVGLPPPSPSGGGNAATPANAFNCEGVSPSPAMPLIPGSHFCCFWGFVPSADGSCVSGGSSDGGSESGTSTQPSSTTLRSSTTRRSSTTQRPSTTPNDGNGNNGVPVNAFNCGGVSPSPAMPLIPGSQFCCNWGFRPNAHGTCISGGIIYFGNGTDNTRLRLMK